LTLTIKNCRGCDLNTTLDALDNGWNKLRKRTIVDNVMVGWHKTLEITTNERDGTYHPHLHIVLAVKPSYISHNHIPKNTWLMLWQDVLKTNYTPTVEVKIGSTLPKILIEVIKFYTKTVQQ
jgi:plasmid rolling circle replication initiator protein Rep